MFKKAVFAQLTAAVLFIVSITLPVLWQLRGYEFISLDDDYYITNNSHVLNGLTLENLKWAFTTVDVAYWHPITWLSHMLDIELYGLNSGGHHFTSAIFHMISTIFLFLFLFRLTKKYWESLIVALLFSLHPLHMESVAWIAQRKEILSALFGFISLWMYAEYLASGRNKSVECWKNLFFYAAFIFFIFALMSKPMSVTIPIVMLLIDYWHSFSDRLKGNREQAEGTFQYARPVSRLLLEKTPFVLASIVSAFVTLYGQYSEKAIVGTGEIPFLLRLENILVSYVKYIANTLYPHDLSLLYVLPMSLPVWQTVGSAMLLSVITILVIRFREKNSSLIVGWSWFLITLLPVIGIIQVGGAQYLADRYTYVPIIGLFMMIVYGSSALLNANVRVRLVHVSVLLIMVITSAILSWRQLQFWKDSVTLFSHSVEISATGSGNYRAHYMLGNALAFKGQFEAAIPQYRSAIKLMFTFPEAHNNLAFALEKQGLFQEAIKENEILIQMDPSNSAAHNSIGFLYYQSGNFNAAVANLNTAIELKPDFFAAYNNLGLALMAIKDFQGAEKAYSRALLLAPNDPNPHFNMGEVYLMQGRVEEAVAEYSEVIKLNPSDAEAIKRLNSIHD